MDKKKSKYKDDELITIRTLSYYQKEGGVYNDLITVLTKLRANPRIRLGLSPVKVLNRACRICYRLSGLRENELSARLNYWAETLQREGNIESLVIFSTMYVLSTDQPYLNPTLSRVLLQRLNDEEIVFPFFDAIARNHKHTIFVEDNSEEGKQLNDLRKQLEEKNKEIRQLKEAKYEDAAVYFEEENNALKERYELLARESRQKELDYKAQIADLVELCKNKDYEISRLTAKKVVKPKTEVDEVLNFDNIMAYIESRGSYDYCDQIFRMLDKLARRIVTDEQLSLIDALEAKMIAVSRGLTINNDIHDNTGDIMPGTVNMNK